MFISPVFVLVVFSLTFYFLIAMHHNTEANSLYVQTYLAINMILIKSSCKDKQYRYKTHKYRHTEKQSGAKLKNRNGL